MESKFRMHSSLQFGAVATVGKLAAPVTLTADVADVPRAGCARLCLGCQDSRPC